MNYKESALHLHSGGVWGIDKGANVIPSILIGENKQTNGKWKSLQTERMTVDQLNEYTWMCDGVGVVHYGQWKCLDFDGIKTEDGKRPVDESVVEKVVTALGLRFTTYPWLQRTPSGGFHLWFWCDDPTPLSQWFGVVNDNSKDKNNVVSVPPHDVYSQAVSHIEVRWGGGCQTVIVGRREDGGEYTFPNVGPHLLSHGLPTTPPATLSPRLIREAIGTVFTLPVREPLTTSPSVITNPLVTRPQQTDSEDPTKRQIRETLNSQWMVEYIQQMIGDTHTEHQDDGWVRIGTHGANHGGWFVNSDTNGWYNHLHEIGGDVFDLIGWNRYKGAWNSKDREMFREVLSEASFHAGVELRPPGQHNNATNAKRNPKEWMLERYELRTNTMTLRTELTQRGHNTWVELNDRMLNGWMVEYEEQQGKWVGKDKWGAYLENHTTAPLYDPIQSYFDSLTWDGEDHLQRLASLVQVEHTRLFLTHLRSWLLRAYRCGYHGGFEHRNEYFLVLTGGQGVGKTTFLQSLIPKPLRKYYSSGVLSDNDNETKHKLAGVFIYLNDELATLGKVSTESLKSLLSEGAFHYRVPYDKYHRTAVRRVSMCGTTNDVHFLMDDTGNRRFLIHHILRANTDALLEYNIDGVWAQIQHLHRQGETGLLDAETLVETAKANTDHAIEKMESLLLKRFTRTCTPIDDNAKSYTTTELCIELQRRHEESLTRVDRNTFGDERRTRSNVGRVNLQPKVLGNILRTLGYEQTHQRRGESGPTRVWWVEWSSYTSDPIPTHQVGGQAL
jgi:hypothetical protein